MPELPERRRGPRRPSARRAAPSTRLFALRAQRRRQTEENTAEEIPVRDESMAAPEGAIPPHGRELAAAFFRPSKSQVLLACVLLVFGFVAAVQLKGRTRDELYGSARRVDLIQLLDGANAETARLEAELNDLNSTRDKLQSGADSARVAQAEAQKRLTALSILAGTIPAQGPGIRLVIFDPKGQVTADMLVDTVQELRDAGAEVIEVNDSIRVVASTWFAQGSSGGLVCDGKAVTRPIVFDVIGDPQTLESAVRFRGGIASQVQATKVGGTVAITQLQSIQVTAVRSIKANQYARPA